MGHYNNCCNSQPQQQSQVFGKLEVQKQYVNVPLNRRGTRVATVLQDVYVQSKSSVMAMTQSELDSTKINLGGKKVSFAEYSKENGSMFLKDMEGNTIIVSKSGKKHVLNSKNQWVSMDEFYGEKYPDVNENIKQAQKENFIKRYGLISGPNGKYQIKDSSKDTRTYDFDFTGDSLKVRLSDGMVNVDGKMVADKNPRIYENGEWRIDENSGPVLREDLNAEIAGRKVDVENLTQGLNKESTARRKADKALSRSIKNETAERKAGDEKLTTDLETETKARAEGDKVLTKGLTTETSERKAGDEKLTTGLATETKARTEGDKVLTEGLTTETKARTEGDKVLTEGLTRETSERKAGDEKLANGLETETKARTEGDKVLTEGLAAEVKTRTETGEKLTSSLGRVEESLKKANGEIEKNGAADANRDDQLCEQDAKIHNLETENKELKAKLDRIMLLLELQQSSPSPLEAKK